ncbi:TPA: CS1-pili formation C-terminal domain-containing protein [Klebsiella oxytoca]|nr:CS1-pili formation C-terminal domain-containing protein [Klebsiella oxytoca]
MNKLEYVKGGTLLGLLLTVHCAFPSNPSMPVRVNNYVIPAVFASALQQGMTVPVYIRYDSGENNLTRSRQKIADAVLSVRNGEFLINQISLSDLPGNTELAPAIKTLLSELKEQPFNEGNRLYINKDASIALDTKSFYLEMTVNKEAMSAAILSRSNLLAASTVSMISSILNYTIGSYISKFGDSHNSGNFLTLDSTSSFREHHLNLNGSLYGIGKSQRQEELYRAMYERDYQGNRIAVGMVDTWNLQSIASMSALNSSRIYGVSYGNKSSTLIEDNTLSLVPITVFLPAAGEVHIFREGRLLSIQNFPMGSYEIDTARLPFGVYDVDIQIVVNGKVANTRKAQINKTFARQSSMTGKIAWQLFSGFLEYNNMDYRHRRNISYGKKETWLAGLAVSITKPWLSGVNMKSTLYGFDRSGVNESEINIAFNDIINFNQQVLLGTEGTFQGVSTLNFAIPGGYGNIWASRKYGYVGDRLPITKGDYFSAGFSANLNRFVPWLGTFSISRNSNKYNGSTYTNADYSQTLFTNRYATVSMNAGLQRYYYNDHSGKKERYINLDISLPLSNWLSAGFSSENGSLLANTSLRKSFDNGPVTQIGASLSKRIRSNTNDDSYQSSDFGVNGYMNYDAKYNTGTLSVSRSSESNTNVSLSSQGNLAWTPESFNLGKGAERSGVVINTDFSEKGNMLAQINGSSYSLTGKSNFISLPPYAEYKIELMNDKNSVDSVDITSGRRNQIVLYPGNISVITPKVKQLVTVFGRVRKPNGAVFASVDIHNHIGKTKTDSNGEFAMDVDKRYPVITLIDKQGGICEADLDLREARGAVWLGDIQCEPQKQVVSLSGDPKNV